MPPKSIESQSCNWFEDGFPHVWLPYTQMQTTPPPTPVVATNGTRIRLADGRELIDGIASWWTACHGYNHPHIRAAVAKQLDVMPHVMFGGLVHEPALLLANRITDVLPNPLSRVFFSESGSVSVEIALKMAIQFWINKGRPERNRIISFLGGYHGDTFGAMSVCDPEEGMHSLFKSTLVEQHVLPLPRNASDFEQFEKFLQSNADHCAAVIIEPLVQGAGGMQMHDAAVLQRLRAACNEWGLLLILDEIFTGFGRTGAMFAHDEAGIVPDIITLSKALTGGTMSLAATVASEDVFEAFLSEDSGAALMHGPTYMANALACAAANASFDLFEQEPRLEQVEAIESQLKESLAPAHKIPRVTDIRVKGAIGVVQLSGSMRLDWMRTRFIEAGVWIRPFRDIVYLTPALNIRKEDLSYLVDSVLEVVAEWSTLA